MTSEIPVITLRALGRELFEVVTRGQRSEAITTRVSSKGGSPVGATQTHTHTHHSAVSSQRGQEADDDSVETLRAGFVVRSLQVKLLLTAMQSLREYSISTMLL